MKTVIGIFEDKIWLIMDNSPAHCSGIVKCYLKKKIWSWIFLPQYTPELASVELFFDRLKGLISTKRTKSVINLDHESGRQILKDAVVLIDKVSIMKIWSHFLSIIQQIIGDLDSIFISIVNFIESITLSTLNQ